MDRASVSGSLCRLCFHIRYLAMGGGHVAGRDGEASDWMGEGNDEWRSSMKEFHSSNVYN